jgi:hypothetical protein
MAGWGRSSAGEKPARKDVRASSLISIKENPDE